MSHTNASPHAHLHPHPNSLNPTVPAVSPVHTVESVVLPEGALEFARDLAHRTGQFLKDQFGQLSASLKKDGTLVTESDLASDRMLTEAILARYPDHAVLSEESDKTYRGQEWLWVIDPIDGTTNFTWGFPVWGVLIGLLHYGQPVLGVADFPMTGEQYSAAIGHGAWRNGAPLKVPVVSTLDPAHLFAYCTRTLKYGKPNLNCKSRIAGSSGFDLATLARGACVGALELRVYVWDVAALWPIVHEAGGLVITNRSAGHDIFPLRNGLDYGAVEFSTLAALSPALLDEFSAKLSDRFKIQ